MDRELGWQSVSAVSTSFGLDKKLENEKKIVRAKRAAPTEVRADAQQDRATPVSAPSRCPPGGGARSRVDALLPLDLLRRTVADEQRLAAPLERHALALGDGSNFTSILARARTSAEALIVARSSCTIVLYMYTVGTAPAVRSPHSRASRAGTHGGTIVLHD